LRRSSRRQKRRIRKPSSLNKRGKRRGRLVQSPQVGQIQKAEQKEKDFSPFPHRRLCSICKKEHWGPLTTNARTFKRQKAAITRMKRRPKIASKRQTTMTRSCASVLLMTIKKEMNSFQTSPLKNLCPLLLKVFILLIPLAGRNKIRKKRAFSKWSIQ
jgi:hypothetical protein